MKKTFILLAFLIVLLSTSCSKDNDNKINVNDLLGKWEFSREGDKIGAVIFWENHEHDCATTKDFLEFLTANLGKAVYHDFDCIPSEDQFGFRLEGNEIIGESGDFDEDGRTFIKELTPNKLVLEFKEDSGELYYLELIRPN